MENYNSIRQGMSSVADVLNMAGIPFRETGYVTPNARGIYKWSPGSADVNEGEFGLMDINRGNAPLAVDKQYEDYVRSQVLGNSQGYGSGWLYDLTNNPLSATTDTFWGSEGVPGGIPVNRRDAYLGSTLAPNNPALAGHIARTNTSLNIPSEQELTNQSREFLTQRAKERGGFMNTVAPVLGAGALALGGIALAPALSSGFGAAAQTGVSAGNAATGGSSFFGSLGNIFGNVNTSQLLSGAAKGALGGYLSGGDAKSALLGGLTGGLAGGYGTAIGQSLGLGNLGSQVFGGALQGASGGLASGDLKGAALGALLGGGMDYIQGGGSIPGLGRAAETINWNQGGASVLSPGEGVLGSLTRGLGTATGGTSMFGNNKNLLSGAMRIGGALYGQGQQEDANEEIRRRMIQAQQDAQAQLQQAQGMFNPFAQAGTQAQNQLMAALSAGFSPQDLASDEGYQFRLNQGQNALQRQMAASGLGQSGAALKAAQEYGQGLAAQEYQDAYDRWLAQNSQLAGQAGMGLGAIGQQAGLQQGIAGLTSDMGGIEAQILAANAANRQRSLSEVLGGLGSIFGV